MVAINDNCALLDNFTKLIRETENNYGVNHLYSVAALTDNNGNVVERYRYDAYGTRTVLEPNGTTVRAASLHGNQIAFTGRYLDAETGLYFFRARYYSGSLGRFIGRDEGVSNKDTETNVKMKKYSSILPDAGRGYVDGFSLYNSYFIPNNIDPSGLACGIKVFQNIPDYLNANWGHEWWEQEYGGNVNVRGFGPSGVCGNHEGAPGVEVYSHNRRLGKSVPAYIYWETYIEGDKLHYGIGKGVPCCKATCEQITDCLLEYAKKVQADFINGNYDYNNLIGKTCKDFSAESLKYCCLKKSIPPKSDMKPDFKIEGTPTKPPIVPMRVHPLM